jgi:hypothetical protein
LIAKNANGEVAVLNPSVFDGDNTLSADKTLEDYMSMDVKGVYQLSSTEDTSEILALLKKHKVLHFPFNYRAGYDSDDAFLINQEEVIFAVTGRITNFQYASLNVQVILAEETDESSDDLDFNMF